MFYIACSNAECPELDVPKECDEMFRDAFDQHVIQCGYCQHPVLQEVPGP